MKTVTHQDPDLRTPTLADIGIEVATVLIACLSLAFLVGAILYRLGIP